MEKGKQRERERERERGVEKVRELRGARRF